MALDNGALHLELDHGDGLVHFRRQARIHGVVDIFIQYMRYKPLAGVVPVHLGREHGQGPQVDAVTVLQHVEAVVADGDAQHVADAGQVARGRSHPGNVVVPPLDVHVVEMHELVHNDVRPGAAVENIADNVQIVDGQILDQLAQGDDELVRHRVVDDGVDDLAVVNPLVVVVVIHMEQLVDHIGELPRHLLSHLGAGVLGGHHLANLHQSVDGNLLKVLGKQSRLADLSQIPVRVIDQVRQLDFLLLGNQVPKGLPDLLPDNAGRAAQQVDKRLIFPVQVAEEILRPLRQSADRHQVNDLAGGRPHRGVLPGQQL